MPYFLKHSLRRLVKWKNLLTGTRWFTLTTDMMIAKKDKFFAQVWNPLYEENELREYTKLVSELDV